MMDVQTEKLSDVLAFINEWIERNDVSEACRKFNIDPSNASKMLRGKYKKPKVEFLKYLKDKALRNYQKLKV